MVLLRGLLLGKAEEEDQCPRAEREGKEIKSQFEMNLTMSL